MGPYREIKQKVLSSTFTAGRYTIRAGRYTIRSSGEFRYGESWMDIAKHDVWLKLRYHAARTSIIINEVGQ